MDHISRRVARSSSSARARKPATWGFASGLLLVGLGLAGLAAPARAQDISLTVNNGIFVLEGNAEYVSIQSGANGMTDANRQRLVRDVTDTLEIGENFDVMVVFTSFFDQRNDDSGITFIPIHNSIQGIGIPPFDQREDWFLSDTARMAAIIFINPYQVLGVDFETNPVLSPEQVAFFTEEPFQRELARTIARRWLFRALFQEGMALSGSLRSGDGADAFLWSNLADSNGSIMGGQDYQEVGENQFELVGQANRGFVPLDRYLMGMLTAAEAAETPLYYLSGATFDGGMVPRGGPSPVPVGGVVSAERVDVDFNQIVAGMGPRNPSPSSDLARPFKRFVFGLLTRDQFQPTSDFQDLRDAIADLKATFDDTWRDLAGIQACTDVENLRQACPEPQLRLEAFSIQNAEGNTRVAPGDTVDLDLLISNTGSGLAEGATATFDVGDSLLQVSPDQVDVPRLEEGAFTSLDSPVRLTVNATTCGTPVPMQVTLQLAEGPRVTTGLSIPVGTEQLRFDPLNDAFNWRVNPDGDDTATAGQWDLTVPVQVIRAGNTVVQPDGDHTPDEGSDLAFITGPRSDDGVRSDVDDGVTTLESPVYALAEARAPVMRVWLWRTAYDFLQTPPEPLDNPLRVEVSTDGGDTFRTLLDFTEQTSEWTLVEIPLREAGVEPSNRTLFRFSIEELNLDPNADSEGLEAGVDDLEIIDFLPGCPQVPEDEEPAPGPSDDDDGGGCRSVPGSAWALWGLAGLAAGLSVLRRRRLS